MKRPGGARRRLVAKDTADFGRDDMYAAAPANLAKRLIVVYAAKLGYPTIVADVSVAFLHAPAGAELIHVEPPDEWFWEMGYIIGTWFGDF